MEESKKIVIHFYSYPQLKVFEPLELDFSEIKAEEAIMFAAEKLNIRTITMYLLSLFDENKKEWIFFKSTITPNISQKLYLRFRWLPPEPSKIRDDVNGCRYLHLQFYNDFRNNNLKLQQHDVIAKERKETLYNTIVFYSIDHCIIWYNSELPEDSSDKITCNNVHKKIKAKNFYPNSHEVKITEWLRTIICLPKALKKHLKNENNPLLSDPFEFVYNLLDFFYEYFDLGLEDKFPGYIAQIESETGVDKVDLIISPYNKDIKYRGVYFINKNRLESMEDVIRKKWKLVWIPTRITNVYFDSKEEGYQFIYCLQGYIRLTCNFYVNIDNHTNVDKLFSIENVQIFGPIKDEKACERLNSMATELRDPNFLIKHRVSTPSGFKLLYIDSAVDPKIYKKNIVWKERQYQLEDGDIRFDSLADLIKYYQDHNIERLPGDINIILKKSAPVNANTVELYICQSDDMFVPETFINKRGVNNQSEIAIVNSEIKLYPLDSLRLGFYTNVCKASEDKEDKPDGEFVFAVKRIRDSKISQHPHQVSIALSKAAQKLAAWKHDNICQIYGVQLYPFKIFLEYSELGSLCSYLARPPKDVTFSFLVSAAEQVARALEYLSNIEDSFLRVHGNIRLRNVLVFEENSTFTFKLADSGCGEVYQNNSERKPPESIISHYSDIFAYGTFLVELFNLGKYNMWSEMGKCPKHIYDDVVSKCCDFDIYKRLPAEKAVNYFAEVLSTFSQENLQKVWVVAKKFEVRGVKMTFSEVPQDYLNSLRIDKSDIVIKGKLGNGHFGEVNEAFMAAKDKSVAVKQIRIDRNENLERSIHDFQKEFLIMSELHHENIVKAIGFMSDDDEGMSNLKIVVEFQKLGSLEKYLKSRKSEIALDMKYKWLKEVAQGMAYLSSEGIVHRDLAARNVLLNENFTAKITDFGLARCTEDGCYQMVNNEIPMFYYSPEVLLNRKYSTEGDVWSYGVFSWEIMIDCQKAPKTHIVEMDSRFRSHITRENVGEYLLNNPGTFYLTEIYKFEDRFKNLLDKCFKVEEKQRASFDAIVKHLQNNF
ncbi:DgyrCDS5879 [Dimorphilus gyrociliatus]|uniref:non-specific protein-tyrosine kinase n=1 Tax=Dimorphilus gyrociliatus TaxID=2664684 RepID=A0A7I8VM18_9ANNE|nr:DgyrCDS5879 [Dimorphilus gyrociliatus]